jgi:hypothetical protein
MKFLIFFPVLFFGFSWSVESQVNKCYAQVRLERKLRENQVFREKFFQNQKENKEEVKNAAIMSIPVVVHVLWNTNRQNISLEQIQSQIDALNKDFRALNGDLLPAGHPFRSLVADVQVEFCLAKLDPSGNPSNGITRTFTQVKEWNDDNFNDLFFTVAGGKDNWDPRRYLNIYVIQSDGSTLGFASFPDELEDYPDYDGVVLHHEVFGTKGTAGTGDYTANKFGRTATHEVGHWLDLYHIWGDEECGNDFVADTPPAEGENYDCEDFPHRAFNDCGAGPNGEMFMNYMDYVDDYCMNMFTKGQAVRMKAAMNGIRKSILNSSACLLTNSVQTVESNLKVNIFPNPSFGQGVFLEIENSGGSCRIQIFDGRGVEIAVVQSCEANFPYLIPGAYWAMITGNKDRKSLKFLVIGN